MSWKRAAHLTLTKSESNHRKKDKQGRGMHILARHEPVPRWRWKYWLDADNPALSRYFSQEQSQKTGRDRKFLYSSTLMTKKCSFTTTKISQLFLMCLMSECLVHFFNVNLSIRHKGGRQKLLCGFCLLREGVPPFPLSFFEHNDFPLRGGGLYPPISLGKNPLKTAIFGQKTLILALFDPFF